MNIYIDILWSVNMAVSFGLRTYPADLWLSANLTVGLLARWLDIFAYGGIGFPFISFGTYTEAKK